MRTRVRLLVIAALVLLLAAGGALLGRELWQRKQDDLRQQVLDLLPNVAQRIQNFHRVKIENGRKVWEVSAIDAQYYEEEELVVVKQPVVSFFLRDGRTVALRGDEGKVFLSQRDLQKVELNGGIDVQLGDYAVRTDYASYERDRDVIIAPGKVEITGKEFSLNGTRLEVEVGKQRLTLAQDVVTTLRPRT